MQMAGFVLAGGRSRRMGQNKALMDFGGLPMVVHVARIVARVADPVTLVGTPAAYGGVGIRTIGDLRPGRGPLAGIEAALCDSQSDWSLIVACDLPRIAEAHLQALGAALSTDHDVVIPVHEDGKLEPLCAVYHRRCLPAVENALNQNRLKVLDLLEQFALWKVPVGRADAFLNVNTQEDWLQAGGAAGV